MTTDTSHKLETTDPQPHLEAGHDVRIWFPDWRVGYLQWVDDPDGGWADMYDSKGVEAGETDSAFCGTCDELELDLTDVIP